MEKLGYSERDIVFTGTRQPKSVYETITNKLSKLKTNTLLRCYPLMDVSNYKLRELNFFDNKKLNLIISQVQDYEQGLHPHPPIDKKTMRSWITGGHGFFFAVDHFDSLAGHLICLSLEKNVFDELISLKLKEHQLDRNSTFCRKDSYCIYIYSISANNNEALIMLLNQLTSYIAHNINEITEVGCLCAEEEAVYLAEAFGLQAIAIDDSYERFKYRGNLIDCVTYSNYIEELYVYDEILKKANHTSH